MKLPFTKTTVLMALSFIAIMVIYFLSTLHVKNMPREKSIEEINVAISPLVQIILSGGDYFLASNLAVFRATTVTIEELKPADFSVLAKIQDDASQLNPAQGDNYYIAQGVLPWAGQHRIAMNILERSTDARPTDFLPPYFLGFDYMYFEGEFEKSGQHYKQAADRVGGKNRDALLNHAARFMEKSNDPATAIQFINSLITSTRDEGLRQFLRVRIARLEGLIVLREAAVRYREQHGRPPKSLTDLLDSQILSSLPSDPLGVGYQLDDQGIPQIIFSIRRFN